MLNGVTRQRPRAALAGVAGYWDAPWLALVAHGPSQETRRVAATLGCGGTPATGPAAVGSRAYPQHPSVLWLPAMPPTTAGRTAAAAAGSER
jgi:hypothetical protein